MNWGKIVEQIPAVIDRIRKDYLLQNMTIKDDIFGILEKLCVVVYYPLENEVNCGFHTKRFVKDRLEDFVYINTAKPLADQVFAAAHELGHVWGVALEVWEAAGETEALTIDEEERIINRFAAELLMPGDEFKKTFWAHMREQKLIPNQVKVEDLVRVMVMQMNDYMVPYESVRRRMIETDIASPSVGEFLLDNQVMIQEWVSAFSKDQNTMLDRVTSKKTIPGLRNLLEIAEDKGLLDRYVISKIKKDFDIVDVTGMDEIIDISMSGDNNGEE